MYAYVAQQWTCVYIVVLLLFYRVSGTQNFKNGIGIQD